MSYAQATNSGVNILKIKEAFPTLPNKKILEIHNIAFQLTRDEKYNIPQRAHLENRLSYLPPTNSWTLSWKKLTPIFPDQHITKKH